MIGENGGWSSDYIEADIFLNDCLNLVREDPFKEDLPPAPLPAVPDSPEIRMVRAAFGGQVCVPDERSIEQRKRDSDLAQRSAMRAFVGTIPPRVRTILECYASRRWNILNLLAYCPGAESLHASNPTLFYMLASYNEFRESAVDADDRYQVVRELICRPQREILAWFGFPATESVRRILARIEPVSLWIYRIEPLLETLHNPVVCKLLRHLPRINDGVLQLVAHANYINYLTPQLLAEVATDTGHNRQSSTGGALRDIIDLGGELDGIRIPAYFTTLDRLRRVHEAVLRQSYFSYDDIIEQVHAGVIPDHLPPPPFPVNAYAIPIRTVDALDDEEMQMEHRVLGYARAVIRGDCYIYRVLFPVRATAQIVRDGSGWRLGHVFGRQRAKIPQPLRLAIADAIFGRRSP